MNFKFQFEKLFFKYLNNLEFLKLFIDLYKSINFMKKYELV